jgi:hypothetical protein
MTRVNPTLDSRARSRQPCKPEHRHEPQQGRMRLQHEPLAGIESARGTAPRG